MAEADPKRDAIFSGLLQHKILADVPHGQWAFLRAVDPEQPVSKVQTLRQHIDASTALLLSAIGIYGVMAHGVAQKTREIGIRMALGAAAKDVVGLVTRQGMRLAVLGLALGAPFAFVPSPGSWGPRS